MTTFPTVAKHRAVAIIPQQLARDIDRLVGKRGRSRFITHAAERELKNMLLLEAFKEAVGSIRSEDHPEWENGSAQWVHDMRQEEERLSAQKRITSDEE